jgi:hypothetical protein
MIATNTEQPHTSQRPLEVPQRPPAKRHIDRAKLLWRGILAVLTIIGASAAWYELRPQISVTAAPSINKNDPFEPPMTITNVGYLEIYNLTFQCFWLRHMKADKTIHPHAYYQFDDTDDPGNNIAPESILAPQTSIVRTCALSMSQEGAHAVDVAITLGIDYRPSFWPWRLSKFARFKSRIDPSGQIQWIPDPQADPFSHK